ncbi:PIN-like domain-containing protein [Kribbella sp. NPDC051137]|uniref:PIN-like domain-containing protein n=1 Tax=Kribbella sp. NPDC051137 TaxID=3155045 RepID=UPI00341EA39A
MHDANETDGAAPLLRQFAAWIDRGATSNEEVRRSYYADAIIVPDANVLLSLYQYTPATRGDLLAALGSISARLWLPHQVGLEFVRGRAGVIKRRNEELSKAPGEISRSFDAAWKQIDAAVNRVQSLIVRYSDPNGFNETESLVTRQQFEDASAPWKTVLIEQAKKVRDEHDIDPNTLAGDADELLRTIADLISDRIGDPVDEATLRRRVERAINFRYPNEIPPGFSDLGKGSELLAAGDFLIWEEIVEHGQALPRGSRVIFVSGDTKEDWYQPAGLGQKKRPWPYLLDEFRLRTGGDILIVETSQFYADIKHYLGTDIAASSIEEANRAVVSADEGIFLPTGVLADLDPPDALLASAYLSVPQAGKAAIAAVRRGTDRYFQWWLIGVTKDLGLRECSDDEPRFDLQAFLRPGAVGLSQDWIPAGSVLRMGEFPYLTMFIAPWFLSVLELCSNADRKIFLSLAHQHGRMTGFDSNEPPAP